MSRLTSGGEQAAQGDRQENVEGVAEGDYDYGLDHGDAPWLTGPALTKTMEDRALMVDHGRFVPRSGERVNVRPWYRGNFSPKVVKKG